MPGLSDEDFLELLEELRVVLEASEVECYNYFVNHSPDGRQCAYAIKSLLKFNQLKQRPSLESLLNRICLCLSLPTGPATPSAA